MDKIKGFFTAIAAPFMAGKRKRNDDDDSPAQEPLISNRKERLRDQRASLTKKSSPTSSNAGKAKSSQSSHDDVSVIPPSGKRARFALPAQENHAQQNTAARFATSGMSTNVNQAPSNLLNLNQFSLAGNRPIGASSGPSTTNTSSIPTPSLTTPGAFDLAHSAATRQQSITFISSTTKKKKSE
jgi:hypothetical protein